MNPLNPQSTVLNPSLDILLDSEAEKSNPSRLIERDNDLEIVEAQPSEGENLTRILSLEPSQTEAALDNNAETIDDSFSLTTINPIANAVAENVIRVTSTRDSGAGTLREAIANAVDGDIIEFANSLAGRTITITSGAIEISPGKNITVDGASAPGLAIGGSNSSQLFLVKSNHVNNASLTLKNLTLRNAYTPEVGGAVRITHQGALTVENVVFKNNVADGGGGAIYSEWETDLTILNSRFEGNEAIADNSERGAGAIAFVSPGSFTVKDSEFINNRGINGAAINSLNGKLRIENSQFIDNDTTAGRYDENAGNSFLRGYGGALYTDRASSRDGQGGAIEIINSVFRGNRGRAEGGAAYLYTAPKDRVLVENSLFEDNEVLALSGGNVGLGGALLQLTNGTNQGFTIRNSTLANNRAARLGGGIWVQGTRTLVENSTFSGNETLDTFDGSFGGAMWLGSDAEIVQSTIAYNHAGSAGGAVWKGINSEVTLRDSILYENSAGNREQQQQVNRSLNDGGNNYQYPPTGGLATPEIETGIDPQLQPLQDNGEIVPTHEVGNESVDAGALWGSNNSSGGSNNSSGGNNDSNVIGEFGSFIIDENMRTIALEHEFDNPVVFVQPLSEAGSQPATVRLTDVDSGSFSAYLQEPNYLDGNHVDETVSYFVFEAGSWELANGARLEVGTLATDRLVSEGWVTVPFTDSFDGTPVISSQVQTRQGGDFVVTRQRNASPSRFQVAMQEEEALENSGHTTETIGWLALEPGSGIWSGNPYQAGSTGNEVTDEWFDVGFKDQLFARSPQFLAGISTFDGSDPANLRYDSLSRNRARIRLQEEESLDSETGHTTESVDFLAISGSGLLEGSLYTDPVGAIAAAEEFALPEALVI